MTLQKLDFLVFVTFTNDFKQIQATDNSSSSNSSRRARAAHHEEENIAPMDAVGRSSFFLLIFDNIVPMDVVSFI